MSATSTIQLRDIAAGLVALDARLDQVAALPPNWDGYNAAPVDPVLVQTIREWGAAMPGWAFAPPPAVVPLSSGAVQLEWRTGSKLLELEFESPGFIHFLRWDPASGVEEEDSFPTTDRTRAEALVAWATTAW
jgi:hypothetical protein